MRCEIISRNDPSIEEYAHFVRVHSNGHFLQSPAWAEAKPLWQWCAIIVRNHNGAITGGISLLYRTIPLRYTLAYIPRGPVCNRSSKAVLQALTQGLKDFARWKRCVLTYMDPDEYESNHSFCRILHSLGFRKRPSNAFTGIQPNSVFRLSLVHADRETLLVSFTQKTRYNIRLAQRKGVVIVPYSGSNTIPEKVMDDFASLMKQTGERDHFFVRNKAYFTQLLYSLGNAAVLYMAYLDDIPIAGTIGIFHGDKAWYLYGASSNEHREVMPNYLLQWTMLCEALNRKCSLYDFRGVPGTGKPDDPLYGLYRFKKGFGGTHIRFAGLFVYYHKPLLGRLFDYGKSIYRKLHRI